MVFAGAGAALLSAAVCCAQRGGVDPNTGIDFARIGSPGNAPWMGDGTQGDLAIGRGQVNYQYYVGKFEVTTAQWVPFMNAAFNRAAGDSIPFITPPAAYGATRGAGGVWTVNPGQGNYMVGGVSWRTAAVYCNWLCNGQSSDRSAFLNGAYDVGTFGQNGNAFTDQLTHNPGAQYWIPTFDEYIKAAHYDPNRFGPGQTGWWSWDNTLGRSSHPGPPGVGEANFGFSSPNPFAIPLGSYPANTTGFGLLDAAGGAAEWTEYASSQGGMNFERGFQGSWAGSDTNGSILDFVGSVGGDWPYATGGISGVAYGLRIASAVPSPGGCALGLAMFGFFGERRSRKSGLDARSARIAGLGSDWESSGC